jgi:hypothetical protein
MIIYTYIIVQAYIHTAISLMDACLDTPGVKPAVFDAKIIALRVLDLCIFSYIRIMMIYTHIYIYIYIDMYDDDLYTYTYICTYVFIHQ